MARRYLMCPPSYFDVAYRINPWMDATVGVDRARALGQWQQVHDAYTACGHTVEVVGAVPGLPDMVFTANAGLVVDGRVLLARFRHPQRSGEEVPFEEAFRKLGYTEIARPSFVNEGEGDYLLIGDVLLGGSGFRTDPRSHGEVSEFFGREVIALELVDPRFYHLDTALAVLDDRTIAYWPGAFSTASRGVLRERFPDAVVADEEDAAAFGLNACSDGGHVIMSAGAAALAAAIRERGFEPLLIDTGELQKAGGAAKCCTLALRG